MATGETASPAAAWQPSADALPAAPSDAPFSPPSEYTPSTGFGAEVATRETGSAASTSAPSDSAAGADCGVVAAASAAVGAPPAGAPLDCAAGADRPGGAALASIVIVDHRALQLDLWKLRRELARRPPRRWQPQPCDAGDLAHG